MSPVTILLRFIFGAILAAALVLWLDVSLPVNVIFVLSVGIMAGVWGDKFLLGLMSLMRYLR